MTETLTMHRTSVADTDQTTVANRVAFLTVGERMRAYHQRVVELGLEGYVTDLNANGYTVIPPEVVAPAAQIEAIRSAVLRVAEKRTGIRHAMERDGSMGDYDALVRGPANSDNQFIMYYMLFEDEEFQKWLENPVLQALVDITMRGAAQLSSMVSFVKWKGEGYGNSLALHSDAQPSPEGVLSSTHDNVCNSALILTDYSRENGALAMVPGSHFLCRQPNPGEGVDWAVPVEAPAGSLIFWRANTWHGAFPKKTEGLRLNLTSYFCNRAMKTQERYQDAVPREVLDKRSEWVARVLGQDDPMGWTEKGPQPTYLLDPFRP